MAEPTISDLLARIEQLEGAASPGARARPRGPRRSRRLAIAVVALATLLLVPVGVFAGHQFTDVPNSQTFHTSISKARGAGFTAGCTATTFCPDAPVTRGQMAAFLVRAAGRASSDNIAGATVTVAAGEVTVAETAIKAGDVTGGTAYVKIEADLYGFIQGLDGCPCVGTFTLTLDGEDLDNPFYVNIDSLDWSPGIGLGHTSASFLAPVPTGVTSTVGIQADITRGDETMTVRCNLVATTFPFGGTGSNVSLSSGGFEPAGDTGTP
jgi:hypothetical protein